VLVARELLAVVDDRGDFGEQLHGAK